MTGGDEQDPTRKLPGSLAAEALKPPGVAPRAKFDEPEEDAPTQMVAPLPVPSPQKEDENSQSFIPTRAIELNKDPTGEWLFPEKKEDTVSRPRRIPRLTGEPASLLQQLGSWLVDLTLIVFVARVIAQDEEVRRLAVGLLPLTARPIFLLLAMMLIVGIPYEVLGSLLWGRSLGRLLFGAELVDASGDTPGLVRSLAHALLAVFSWCGGFVLTFVDRKGQMLHEKLTSTWVVRAGTSGLK